jgi:phage terminase Nu1 subunit (DNA packaging protein)
MKREQTTADILEAFEINRQTLASWVRKGCPCTKPKTKGKGKQNKFDQNEVAAWMKSKNITGAVGRPGGPITEQLQKAKLRKETAMAELHEMRSAKERGLLVDRQEQERNNVKKFALIRSKFAALPAAVAPSLAGLTVPTIEAVLQTRIIEVLAELSRA